MNCSPKFITPINFRAKPINFYLLTGSIKKKNVDTDIFFYEN